MLLAGCSSLSPKTPAYVGIDPVKLTPCSAPASVSDATVGDILQAALDYKSAFLKCAAKIDAIRKDDADKRAIYGR
jgi:hypothetical protein